MQEWKAEKLFTLVSAEHCIPVIVAVLLLEQRVTERKGALVQVCCSSCRLVVLDGPWQSCGSCWAVCRCCVAEMHLRSNHWTWFMSVWINVHMLIYVHLSQLTCGSLQKCGEANVVQCLYPVGVSTVVVILWGIPGNVVMKLSVKVTMKSDRQSDDSSVGSSQFLLAFQHAKLWMVYIWDKHRTFLSTALCTCVLLYDRSCGMLGQMHVGKRERIFELPYSQ